MKRNIGIIALLIIQAMKAAGIDMNIGQTEMDTIGSGAAIILQAIGTLHDLYRKWREKKVKK
ncbi:MAG: hypothetical protein IMZ53_09565 [Thermoplasmata archaeon]|nr:hypothetical protein [Thermoplasmata archaeon]MBE3140817.1 hypothetical protein [Thermoplasmata archaeon]